MPTQPDKVGVTEIVEVTGTVPVLTAVNAGVLPDPLPANPIDVFELVQVKVAPAGVEVKLEAAIPVPLQVVIFPGTFATGGVPVLATVTV